MNTWNDLAPLPQARWGTGAVFVPWGQILVPGGVGINKRTSRQSAKNTIFIYSIVSDSWDMSNETLQKGAGLCAVAAVESPWLVYP